MVNIFIFIFVYGSIAFAQDDEARVKPIVPVLDVVEAIRIDGPGSATRGHVVFNKIFYNSPKGIHRVFDGGSWIGVRDLQGRTPLQASIATQYQNIQAKTDLAKDGAVLRYLRQGDILKALVNHGASVSHEDFQRFSSLYKRAFAPPRRHDYEKSLVIAENLIRAAVNALQAEQVEVNIEILSACFDLLCDRSAIVSALIEESKQANLFAGTDYFALFMRNIDLILLQDLSLKYETEQHIIRLNSYTSEMQNDDARVQLIKFKETIHNKAYGHHLIPARTRKRAISFDNDDTKSAHWPLVIALVIRAIDLDFASTITMSDVFNYVDDPMSFDNKKVRDYFEFGRRLELFIRGTMDTAKTKRLQECYDFWHAIHDELIQLGDFNGAFNVAMGLNKSLRHVVALRKTFPILSLAVRDRTKNYSAYFELQNKHFEANNRFIPSLSVAKNLAMTARENEALFVDESINYPLFKNLYHVRWAFQESRVMKALVEEIDALHLQTMLLNLPSAKKQSKEFFATVESIMPPPKRASGVKRMSKHFSSRIFRGERP